MRYIVFSRRLQKTCARIAPILLLAPLALGAEPTGQRGDAARGDSLSATCVTCHGPDGNSPAPAFPSVAGQGFRYLYEQMRAIRDGRRSVPVMVGQLDAMSDQDLRDIATWYSNNEAQIGQATQQSLERGQILYKYGDMKRQIPACSACHGPDGRGIASAGMPSLSGQHSTYLLQALQDYGSGKRSGLNSEAMSSISGRLTEADMRALAEFMQGLY